jgi:hypothetical protein
VTRPTESLQAAAMPLLLFNMLQNRCSCFRLCCLTCSLVRVEPAAPHHDHYHVQHHCHLLNVNLTAVNGYV